MEIVRHGSCLETSPSRQTANSLLAYLLFFSPMHNDIVSISHLQAQGLFLVRAPIGTRVAIPLGH